MFARTVMYGSAALLAAGAIGWEVARRRAIAEMRQAGATSRDAYEHMSEGDVWQSVSEDVELTLLGNPDGVFEFQQQKAALLGEPPAIDVQRSDQP
jgi:hypothetical protein